MRSRFSTSFHLVFLLALVCSAQARAQAQSQPQSQPQPTPTLRIETRLVLLDIHVTDKQGHSVTDLHPEDFKVYEKNVEQKILSFEPPSAHTLAPAVAGKLVVNSSADLPKIGDAPVTVLILDELNMSLDDEIYTRDKTIQWLSRQPAVLPQPTALSAITYENFTLLRDFTQDRDALLAILRKRIAAVPWRSDNAGRVGPAASDNLFATLGALERMAQVLRGVPGRKNVLWLGNGFPSIEVNDVGAQNADLVKEALRRLSNIMLHARVTLSIIGSGLKESVPVTIETSADASQDSASGFEGVLLAADGELSFGSLAAPTGGHAYGGRNDLDAEIERSISEGDSFYSLSYRPSDPDNNPKEYRRIRVDITRPGLLINTRDGYFGEQPLPAVLGKAATQQLGFDLLGAASSNFAYTDLHLTVERHDMTSFTLAAAGRDVTWSNLPDGRRHADFIVLAACFSARGRMLSHTFTLLGASTDATLESINQRKASLQVHLVPPPGTTRIRFVVRDATGGHIGTTDLTIP